MPPFIPRLTALNPTPVSRRRFLEANLAGGAVARTVAQAEESATVAGEFTEPAAGIPLADDVVVCGGGPADAVSGTSFCYDPEVLKLLLEELCLEAGVTFQYHTKVSAAFREGRRQRRLHRPLQLPGHRQRRRHGRGGAASSPRWQHCRIGCRTRWLGPRARPF